MSAIATSSNSLTEICPRHHGKALDMYCRDDGEFGCSECIAIGHRSCTDVVSIHEVRQSLSEHVHDLVCLRQNRLDHKARLKNEKETCLTETDERMDAIIQHVRTLRTAFRNDILDRYEKFTNKLDDDERLCDDFINKLESIDTLLQRPVVANASQTLTRAEALMKDAEVRMGECKRKRSALLKITFKTGHDVNNLLSEAVFGRLIACRETPILYNQTKSMNVRIQSDQSACYITDLCSLPDGTIIITDYSNKKLNSLQYDSDTYRVSDYLSLSGYPWGVCSLDGNEVAVTLPDQHKIHIVNVGKPMGFTNTFQVDHGCYGIAHAESCLYISHYYESKVTVYDTQGNLRRTISKDNTGATLFVRPQHLCVLPSHRHIAVAAKDEGVVVVDMAGNLVTRYTYPNMRHTKSVCVDGRGTLYIADSGSKDIAVLDVDKSVTSLLLGLPDYPLLVTYDAHANKLMVTVQGNSHIYTFSLDY